MIKFMIANKLKINSNLNTKNIEKGSLHFIRINSKKKKTSFNIIGRNQLMTVKITKIYIISKGIQILMPKKG